MTTLSAGTGMAMVAFALSRGLTMAEIQDAMSVTCHDLLNPEARLPEGAMPRLWVLLSERFPGEPLTLEMARAAPFSFFGGLADGAQFADDLRTAIGLMIKNRAVIADRLELYLREEQSEVRLVTWHPLNHIDSGRSAETGMALVARLFAEFLGVHNCVQRVTLSHKPSCDVAHYVDYFGAPVEFNAREIALVLKPEKLNTRIKHANVELFNYVETFFAGVQKQKTRFPSEPRELTLLREAATENVRRGIFGAASVAAAANMSLRTAQRITAAHGTSVQELIESVRETRAKEFLRDDRMDIGSIALLLGYSDDRAFRRAFQRWTGQSPSAYRHSLKSGNE